MTKLVTTKEKAETLRDLLEKYKPQLENMLPDTIGVDRFNQIVLSQVRTIPKLLDCKPQSFIGAAMEAVKLNLMPGIAGQAWIIPYKGEATFIPGYRGMLQLAWRSNHLKEIYADVIRENDEYEYVEFPRKLYHKAVSGPDGGEMIATYTYSKNIHNGEHITFLRDWQIEAIKKRSPAAAFPQSPWNSPIDEPEMWKKSGFRKHCKTLPMSTEFERAASLDEQAELGQPQGLEIPLEDIPEAEEVAENGNGGK